VTRGLTGFVATSDGAAIPPAATTPGSATEGRECGGATMSRVVRFAAGAATAATSPKARLCWHRSTNRLLFSGMTRHS
jgi:hypothetical protein